MNIPRKLLLPIILSVSLLISINQSAAKSHLNPYIVIDTLDGSVIAANRESDRWYPASLTKLMTAYVTMKAIGQGEIKAGSPVRITNAANKMPPSRMAYRTGVKMRVDTALKIIIVKSANDVSVALAQAVAGNVEDFVERMNRTAASLGMTATQFTNPNGLHSKNQFTSARDLAILARRILLDFPQYSAWFAIPAIRTETKTYYSYNLLLERFVGANGMKTGFVCASGYNFVASASRNGRLLIAVILGAKSQTDRAVLAARLLSEAFSRPHQVVGNIVSGEISSNASPKNMRPVLCTQQARKNRYEPGAGKAVIKSQYLSDRKITRQPSPISIGGINAPPGEFTSMPQLVPRGKIMIPTRRPNS